MIFEVCCGSSEDAYNAFLGGADRIELNSALFMGGLTPSLGSLILTKKLVTVPIMVMVRPREGGFCYTELEYKLILQDAKLLLENGADGLVFGFLKADGMIDEERTAELIKLCKCYNREAVFSRAIDVTPDIVKALELLDKLGVDRVLTSGGKPTALEGATAIKEMLLSAQNIEILPGAGINPQNVSELINKTGVKQVHSSARKLYYDTSVRANKEIFFGGKIDGKFNPEDEFKITDPEAVALMKKTLELL